MRAKGQLFDLKRFRAERNLTQKEISEAVNCPQSYLSAIENGKRSASQKFVENLSRIYNVNNISQYILERDSEATTFPEVIKNSARGQQLISEIENKMDKVDILRILSIIQSKMIDNAYPPPPPETDRNSVVEELVKLLADANARCNRAEERIKELEAQVLALQTLLPKRNTQNECISECK